MLRKVEILPAASKILGKVRTADAAAVTGPRKHLFEQVDGPSQDFQKFVFLRIFEEGFCELITDINHQGVLLQKPQNGSNALFSFADSGKLAEILVRLVMLLKI